MAYKALYRTYRPSTFEQVAGQTHIVKTLQNALISNKIAHAYLFCGPRGTGKTTMAKLLAKALNCEDGIGHQCNKCSNCLAINDGSHPDVIEIDAASNNGVEDVRDIIERVKYSPIKGRYKVYIIDEVHMMSPNAFNALLKTLEEPPANVIFILATTEPHKILPTILSRCQRYDFSKIDDNSLTQCLTDILKKENIKYDEPALKQIISLADGGARDALSLLDQAIAYSGAYIKEKDIEDIFGLISVEQKIELLSAICDGDIHFVLSQTESLIESGIDIRRLTHDLLDVLKDIVIYDRSKSIDLLSSLDEKQAQVLCEKMSSDTAIKMIDVLMQTQADFRNVSNIRSLFEISILKLVSANSDVDDAIYAMPKSNDIVKPAPTQAKAIEQPKPLIKEEVNTPKVQPKIDQPIALTNIFDEIPDQAYADDNTDEEEISPILVETKPIENDKVSASNENKIKDPALQSDELPPFMVDDELEIDANKIVPEFRIEGPMNSIDDEDIISLMVLGNKDSKLKLVKEWSKLDKLTLNPKYAKYASLLKEGKPFILTKEILVLQYDFGHLTRKANVKDNQQVLQDIVEMISGNKVKVYAVERKLAVMLYGKFQNLYQVNKLPKPNSIIVKFNF